MSESDDRPVVTEAAAIETLAYRVSAARTQLGEAAEYAPLRLITAAQVLARGLRDASPEAQALVAALDSVPETATPTADPEAYTLIVDNLCVAVADCLLAINAGEHG